MKRPASPADRAIPERAPRRARRRVAPFRGAALCRRPDGIAPLLRLGARNDASRYVASNLAYNAAKLAPGERDGFVDWLAEVEFEIFELPRPDLTCLLATPPEIADSLVAQKPARSYTEMTRDLHEADRGYMARVAEVYERLAREERDSPWFRCASVKAEGGLRPPGEIADEVWHRLAPLLEGS